jgi:hypothetical protein
MTITVGNVNHRASLSTGQQAVRFARSSQLGATANSVETTLQRPVETANRSELFKSVFNFIGKIFSGVVGLLRKTVALVVDLFSRIFGGGRKNEVPPQAAEGQPLEGAGKEEMFDPNEPVDELTQEALHRTQERLAELLKSEEMNSEENAPVRELYEAFFEQLNVILKDGRQATAGDYMQMMMRFPQFFLDPEGEAPDQE